MARTGWKAGEKVEVLTDLGWQPFVIFRVTGSVLGGKTTMTDDMTEALSASIQKLRDFIHLTMREHPGVCDFAGTAPAPPVEVQAAYDAAAQAYASLEKTRQGLVMAAYHGGVDPETGEAA